MELLPIKPLESLAAPLPTPLERLRLTPALSGAAGSNRAPASATRIAAADDLAALTAWLARYADSAATIATYRREVERLILWRRTKEECHRYRRNVVNSRGNGAATDVPSKESRTYAQRTNIVTG